MVFGVYERTSNSARYWRNAYGGACLFDLDQVDLTGHFTLVIDPVTLPLNITAVAPHPQVADTWAILPTLDGGLYPECADWRHGVEPSYAADYSAAGYPMQLACTYPWPILMQGSAAGFELTTLTTSYPSGRVSSAMWSELDVPDDSDDLVGSYLVVGTQGQGTWRGDLTW